MTALACDPSLDSLRPFEREGAKVRALMFSGKYSDLERVDAESRQLSKVISDGQPLRGALVRGLDGSEIDCSYAPINERRKRLAVYQEKAAAWKKTFPDSTTPMLIEALYPLREAWIARGGDYAYKVPPEAWPIFHRNVESSRAKLEALPPKVKEDPAWHVARLGVARLQSDPAYPQLLEAALDRFPDYLPLYFEGETFYEERWGGNAKSRAAFIDQSVTRTSSQLGETLYARLHWSGQTDEMFATFATDWKRMKAGFERIIKDYPDSWNLNNYAKFACMARDSAALREILPRIQDSVIPDAWEDMGFYKFCKTQVAAEGYGLQPR